tara:strand:+ start:866 stop:1051 length:186 start_codon:yes stop_codon:yes gene_type:complete
VLVAVDKTKAKLSLVVAVLVILVVVEMLEDKMPVVMEMVEVVLALSPNRVDRGQLVPCGSK